MNNMAGSSCLILAVLLLGVTNAAYQEMTHLMDTENMMIHVPFFEEKYHFTYRIDQEGPIGDAEFVAWNSYSTVEHMGTHYDSPYHCYEDGRKTEDIPLEDFNGPLVRIDITDKVALNNMSTVDVEDLLAWEEAHGPIPERAYLLMYSGWGQHWGDQDSYVGTGPENPDYTKLAWPGWSIEAVAWLLENRDFLGIGVDTVSCDPAYADIVHTVLLPADKMCIENLHNMDKVPDSGAEFYYLPLLMKGGTGGQIRAYAFWDTELYHGGAPLFGVNIMLLATLLVQMAL